MSSIARLSEDIRVVAHFETKKTKEQFSDLANQYSDRRKNNLEQLEVNAFYDQSISSGVVSIGGGVV